MIAWRMHGHKNNDDGTKTYYDSVWVTKLDAQGRNFPPYGWKTLIDAVTSDNLPHSILGNLKVVKAGVDTRRFFNKLLKEVDL